MNVGYGFSHAFGNVFFPSPQTLSNFYALFFIQIFKSSAWESVQVIPWSYSSLSTYDIQIKSIEIFMILNSYKVKQNLGCFSFELKSE